MNSSGELAASRLMPSEYDALESAERMRLTNRMIEAFRPVTFAATGYPVHVSDERELWRYVDVMHETRLRDTIENVLHGLTPDEFAVFRRAISFMCDFTVRNFGKPLRCENALLRAMNVYRYIRAFNPRTVMELGPGSGYLGLLHILDGTGYIGCDNSQSFYLLQNRLWATAAGDRFSELAQDPRSLRAALSEDLHGKAVHVPWWKLIDLELDALPAAVDVVTANHCLAEMQHNALRYSLRLAYRLLAARKGPVVFEGWGYELLHPRALVAREFDSAGFGLYHLDDHIAAFASRDRPATEYLALPRPVSLKRRLRNFTRRIVGLERIPYEYDVTIYSGHNDVSSAIRHTNDGVKKAATLNYADVTAFLSKVYGDETSPEERFLALIDRRYG